MSASLMRHEPSEADGHFARSRRRGEKKNKAALFNLVPRALFPGFEGGAGKGPGIGRPIRYFDWLIDLGKSCFFFSFPSLGS